MAASAVAQPSAEGKVPMRIADARVAFDRPVVAHGRLARADAGRELILEYRDAAGVWQPLASAVVAGDGRWRVSATLPHTAPVRVTLHGAPGAATASSDPRHSSERTIAVTARVRVGGRRLHVEAGRRAAVRGRVLPAAAGRRVALQMRRGGRWVTLDRGRTRADGAYRLRRRVPTALEARVRVVVARSPGLSQARRPVGRL
jgi:hypothetical protein